jgi:hypothetical protein
MASILDVRKGDIIVERNNGKKSMIPVRKVEFFVCSTKGVHVNDNACYDNTAVVTLVAGEGTLSDLESGLGDLEEDYSMIGDAMVADYEALAELFVKH